MRNQFSESVREAMAERRRRAMAKLRASVAQAIREYDQSGDHASHDPVTEPDCIRCRLAEVLR